MGINLKKFFTQSEENDVFSNNGDEFYEIKTDISKFFRGKKIVDFSQKKAL